MRAGGREAKCTKPIPTRQDTQTGEIKGPKNDNIVPPRDEWEKREASRPPPDTGDSEKSKSYSRKTELEREKGGKTGAAPSGKKRRKGVRQHRTFYHQGPDAGQTADLLGGNEERNLQQNPGKGNKTKLSERKAGGKSGNITSDLGTLRAEKNFSPAQRARGTIKGRASMKKTQLSWFGQRRRSSPFVWDGKTQKKKNAKKKQVRRKKEKGNGEG